MIPFVSVSCMSGEALPPYIYIYHRALELSVYFIKSRFFHFHVTPRFNDETVSTSSFYRTILTSFPKNSRINFSKPI